MLKVVIDEPDFEWLMIDASHAKTHQHACGAVGGNDSIGRTKGGSTRRSTWPWMRLAFRSEQLSLRVPLRIAQLQRG